MKKRTIMLLASMVAVPAGIGPIIFYDPYEKTTCVALSGTPFSDGRVGYEIIDLGRRVVWGTSNWTLSEFQNFETPWHKPLHLKNDPRTGYADSGKIVKSPGCKVDGEYNTLRAYGREFQQVVRLISFKRIGSGKAQLKQVILEKYHRLYYRSGTTVRVLHAPNGEQYVAVSYSIRREAEPNPLPAGWRIATYLLSEEFELDLSGAVTNIRTPNTDSFQGPVPPRDHFPR